MLIVHESLEREAKKIKQELRKLFDIPVDVRNDDLEGVYPSVKGGFFWSPGLRFLAQDSRARLILTSRDLFWSRRPKEDDWVYGVSYLPSASVLFRQRVLSRKEKDIWIGCALLQSMR